MPLDNSLLPPRADLEALSNEKVKVIVELADHNGQRNANYATAGLMCGTVSFLAALGSFVYLVMNHHDAAGDIVLGTAVLAIIGTMIRSRNP